MATTSIATGDYWDYLVEHQIVSEETLKVVCDINGYNTETLDDVLYATTGYRSYEQYNEAMDSEELTQ